MQNSKSQNTYQKEQGTDGNRDRRRHEQGQTKPYRRHRMTGQEVKETHRLNTQTLINQQGTGEERGGRRPGEVTKGRSTEEQTEREQGRQTEGRPQEKNRELKKGT